MKKQFTDSTLWREKIEEMIKRGTNMREDTYVRVSLSQFKQFDHTKKNGKVSCINSFVESIDEVITASRIGSDAKGYSLYMNNGDSINIFDDGTLIKLDRTSHTKSSRVGVMEDGHIRTTVSYPRQTTIFLERLMYIAHCIYNDCLPSSLDGVSCNVMDTSGNSKNEFRAKYNLSPDNLEFCNVSMNSTAYQTAKKLYELTGKLYRFSAYDVVLEDAVRNRPVDDIIWYINRTGIQEVSVE